MDSADEIILDTAPFIVIYKSGRTERSLANDFVPPSVDPVDGVSSKDALISPETGVAARLYLPAGDPPGKKLPLLIYFHGGGFCVGSAFSTLSHNYMTSLVARANVVAVSVDYSLAPEHTLPAAFEDAWAALQWVASGGGGDEWLAQHSDFDRVYLLGESAGANISHHMALRAGSESLDRGVKIKGAVLIHPYFEGSDPVGSDLNDAELSEEMKRMWKLVFPSVSIDDPWISPLAGDAAATLSGLGCERVLLCLADKDVFRDRGREYYHALKGSGWKGDVEMWEGDMGHLFHLANVKHEMALAQEGVITGFLNRD
nr:alpha/beta hydrolase 1 [Gloriosa superba]